MSSVTWEIKAKKTVYILEVKTILFDPEERKRKKRKRTELNE